MWAKILSASLVGLLGAAMAIPVSAAAETIGSNLATAPNESLCRFESSEPASRFCIVGQHQLTASHSEPAGLTAPFDGVVVGWSVVSGVAPPGTGVVKLALRTTAGPGYLQKGPEVELPLGSPGTRYSFPERMSVSARQPLGLAISVANRNGQAAGAPIAFREDGVGVVDTYTGEPFAPQTIWDQEEDIELMMNAIVEADADHDGYGDLTQDCFPGTPLMTELCGRDIAPPAITLRFRPHQPFLRSGVVSGRIYSSEAGRVSASGLLEIKGPHGRTASLRNAAGALTTGSATELRLRLLAPALRAAKAALAEGKRVLVAVSVRAVDASGNDRLAFANVRPSIMRKAKGPKGRSK